MQNTDLGEKARSFGVSLAKKDIVKVPILRVGAAFDESTSMRPEIEDGRLQSAFNQTMGITVKFDDNAELDCLAFNDECRRIGVATPANFETFVERKLRAGGSTRYAPIVTETVDMFFSKRRAPGLKGLFGGGTTDMTPALMMVLTDGDNDRNDNPELDRALGLAQRYPLFFQFVGIGRSPDKFPTIRRLAKTFPNVGEVYLPRFDMPDSQVYDQIASDSLVGWLRQFQ